jgi:hypothetical protein
MRFIWTILISVLAAVALAAPAQAAPCWEAVIEDWFDNSRVDKRYPIHCYREALANMPEDMQAYSSAPEDIARAMRREIARQNQGGSTTTDTDGGQTGGGLGGAGGSGGNPKPTAPIGTTEPGGEAAPPAESADDGIFPEAIKEIGPSDASSFPLPLAVLLGVALLLVAAGGMGLIARRMRPPRSPLRR